MPPVERDDLIMALMKGIDPEKDPELYKETLEAFETASDRDLYAWYEQQNDPQQAKENAWGIASHAAKTDLSQHSLPEITDAQREAIMEELSSDVDTLSQALELEQDQSIEQEHEH